MLVLHIKLWWIALLFPFMPCSFWHTHTIRTCILRNSFGVCALSVRGCSHCLLCLAMFRVHLIAVMMLGKTQTLDWAWARITQICILKAKKKCTTNKWVAFFFCTWPPQKKHNNTWCNSLLQDTRSFIQYAPISQMTQTVGMNQPFSRQIWSQTGYQPSYMWCTWISLMKADPRSEPGGVGVLLNRKWMRSNAPIRLRCGETKHHHPTGRK